MWGCASNPTLGIEPPEDAWLAILMPQLVNDVNYIFAVGHKDVLNIPRLISAC